MRNRLLGWTMAVSLFFSCAVPSAWMAALFEDIPDAGELHDAAVWAAERDITKGRTETRFCPQDTCTRAQILTFLWRYCGREQVTGKFPFSDVSPDTDYGKAAHWAYRKGLLDSQDLGQEGAMKFNGSTTCRRKEAALYLWRLAGSPYEDPCALHFTDVEPYAAHAVAVAWAVNSGITKGRTDTSFAPEDGCTRGHIVMFLYRFDRYMAAQDTQEDMAA